MINTSRSLCKHILFFIILDNSDLCLASAIYFSLLYKKVGGYVEVSGKDNLALLI